MTNDELPDPGPNRFWRVTALANPLNPGKGNSYVQIELRERRLFGSRLVRSDFVLKQDTFAGSEMVKLRDLTPERVHRSACYILEDLAAEKDRAEREFNRDLLRARSLREAEALVGDYPPKTLKDAKTK